MDSREKNKRLQTVITADNTEVVREGLKVFEFNQPSQSYDFTWRHMLGYREFKTEEEAIDYVDEFMTQMEGEFYR